MMKYVLLDLTHSQEIPTQESLLYRLSYRTRFLFLSLAKISMEVRDLSAQQQKTIGTLQKISAISDLRK